MGLGETEFVEIGTGTVLTGLIKKIRDEAVPLVIEKSITENIAERPEAENGLKEVKVLKTANSKGSERESRKSLQIEDAMKEASCTADLKEKETRVEQIKDNVESLVEIVPQSLGSSEFKKAYNLKYGYLAGGMFGGVSSGEMVVKMGKAGMMGFLGTGGLELLKIEEAVRFIQKQLAEGQAYGLNLPYNPSEPEREERVVDLCLALNVRVIEASAFLTVTPSLVKYHAKGLKRDKAGKIICTNRIIAKVSRPEVAEVLLSPAPERIINKLFSENKITAEEAGLLKEVPVVDDICVEADSAGHAERGAACALMPVMAKSRDEIMEKFRYRNKISVGCSGGIGSPEAAAAAFMLGADFILTGSINQCTAEASTSDAVKDLLQKMNVCDTEYVPSEYLFEMGAKIQVAKRGVFFPARANKLYTLYCQYNSLDEIDEKTRKHIQEKYFKRSFEKVFDEIKLNLSEREIERAESNPKHKMSLVFKWYFDYCTKLALSGKESDKVNYKIPCSPALGAFNHWIKGTELENWRNRHVDDIAKKLIVETAVLLNQRYYSLRGAS